MHSIYYYYINIKGIKTDYWIKKKEHFGNKLSADPKHQHPSYRRSSQIALLAGADIPFAEAINLVGQLEVDWNVQQKWKNRLKQKKLEREREKQQNLLNKNSNKPRRSFLGRSKNKNNDGDEKKDELNGSTSNIYNREEIIPFILPQEGLNTLLSATKCIYKTAMKYYYQHYPEKKNDKNDDGAYISQDDLFPIILYCVMQSKLETPHRLIYFIEHILPKEKTTMGQSAFALSALKAAVEYISQAKPETFGMDKEIELD